MHSSHIPLFSDTNTVLLRFHYCRSALASLTRETREWNHFYPSADPSPHFYPPLTYLVTDALESAEKTFANEGIGGEELLLSFSLGLMRIDVGNEALVVLLYGTHVVYLPTKGGEEGEQEK